MDDETSTVIDFNKIGYVQFSTVIPKNETWGDDYDNFWFDNTQPHTGDESFMITNNSALVHETIDGQDNSRWIYYIHFVLGRDNFGKRRVTFEKID